MSPSQGHDAWRASLDLGFTRREDATLLTRNRHEGPLQVQKALYPEGAGTCHVIVLHPPGGIAAGDSLHIEAHAGAGARGLLTSPGAAKWYRSEGPRATQRVRLVLEGDAVLEWLPRENIFFDSSRIGLAFEAELSADARYLGWEILGFGRRASGETWRRGSLTMCTRIRRAGRVIWSETADLDAASGFLQSPVGLGGSSVCGTLVAAGCETGDALLKCCRGVVAAGPAARLGITRLPSVLIARYVGDSTQQALAWFTDLWRLLRPELLGRPASIPRVWAC